MPEPRGKRRPIPYAVRRSTPLESAAQRYGNWLRKRGYSPFTVENYQRMVRHLAWWMIQRGRGRLSDVNEELVRRFIAHHLPQCRCYVSRCVLPKAQYENAAAALCGFLVMLREEGVLAPLTTAAQTSPASMLLDDFGEFLRRHRGTSESTIASHQRFIRDFLSALPDAGLEQALAGVSLVDVREFALAHAKSLGASARGRLRAALVALFGYLRTAGYSTLEVEDVLPRVRRYRLASLPVAISRKEVERLLAGVDRSTACGRRDYAMLLLLATYGLRSHEVCRLRLEDIDWRHRRLRIRAGKTGRERVLPLTASVGDALYDYLRQGRRKCAHREVFLTVRPPGGPFRANPYHMVSKYFMQAEINSPHRGAHTLRHSLAVQGVRAGLPLKTIGDLLGHRHPDSTAIYTKLQVEDLRQVALELEVPR